MSVDATEKSLGDFFAGPTELALQGPALFRPQTHAVGTGNLELLAFRQASEEYALNINYVQEIITVPYITHLPNVAEHVLGIISLRGTIVPVVDLRQLLFVECTPITRASRILFLRSGSQPIGFLVDSVSSVVRLDQETVEGKPRGVSVRALDLLAGVGRVGRRMLIIIDVPTLLANTENLA